MLRRTLHELLLTMSSAGQRTGPIPCNVAGMSLLQRFRSERRPGRTSADGRCRDGRPPCARDR